ncbi:MAG: sulfide/dihydroorotate dehydrogenase-like FAD/NAD-binding protein [Candidatus Krumholzibacteria bacterium]|nr:sulfide/dihydroorotate dehydrogenase-like FAD/NAD-binding protein [Candidatus Krumholzibacteria bacterium]
MHKVVERTRIVPNIHLLRVEAPEVVRKLQPGNFVIVKIDQIGERIPLTAADWDEETGIVSLVFMTVGASTHRLAQLEAGDEIEACVGPLGRAQAVDKFGTVVTVMGCYGIGAMLPVARAMKKAGNRVIAVIEARTEELLYWQDKYDEFADRIVLTTYGLSCAGHGRAADALQDIIDKGVSIDRVVALGCTYMMMRTAEATRPFHIKTIVGLNPVMIDGTGMCGVCRCTVGGQTKFACVDGPHFDAHEVDWQELTFRRRSYLDEEVRALSEFETRTY